MYKGRKKKTIEYFAIKSVDKSQKSKVLQEVLAIYKWRLDYTCKFYIYLNRKSAINGVLIIRVFA